VAEQTAVVGVVFVELEPFVAEGLLASCLVVVSLEKFCQFDFSVELEGIFADPQSYP
jgi:hypothetical protein